MDYLPIPEEKLVINSTMGHQRQDYEAFYTLSPVIWLSEIHNHNFYEIYFHLHGGHTLYVNGHIYTLEPGCLMIFPPFQLHGIIQKEVLRDYERAVLYITPELLRTLGCGLMDFERQLLAPSSNGHYQFHMNADVLQHCILLLQTIAKNTDDFSPQTKLQDYANMIKLLLDICQVIGDGQNAFASQPVNDTVRQVLTYIQENYAEPLSLEMLATHFNVSRSTLSHAFSRCTNSSVSFIVHLLDTAVERFLPNAAQRHLLSSSSSFFSTAFSVSNLLFRASSSRFSARSFSASVISASGFRFPRRSSRPSAPFSLYFLTHAYICW